MKNLSWIRKMVTLCGVICLMVGASWSQVAHAFNPQPDPPGFGMFGIANGQTAHLNVKLERLDTKIYSPDPFRVTLYFLNGDGRTLTQQTFAVSAGQSVILDYAPPALPTGLRQRIRPIVIVEPDASGVIPDYKAVVEVLDNDTQRNVFVYAGAYRPQVDRISPTHYDSGLIGINRGQVARLNVVNTADVFNPVGIPPDPYRVTLSFYTSAGVLLTQITKSLAPGQTALLDVSARNFPSSQDARLEVYAVVSVEPDARGIAPCVMPTVEGFNLVDGKTSFLVGAN